MSEVRKITQAAQAMGHFNPDVADKIGQVVGYEALELVLSMAYQQAACGKGKERHAGPSLPFHEQPMQRESDDLQSALGLAFQARKKVREGLAMEQPDRQIKEVLGAINYLAGWVIWTLRQEEQGAVTSKWPEGIFGASDLVMHRDDSGLTNSVGIDASGSDAEAVARNVESTIRNA